MNVASLSRLLLLLASVSSCASSSPGKDRLASVAEHKITQSDLHLRSSTRDYAERFAGEVERAADRIVERTGDVSIQRNALLWKINAVPACFRATFNVDPVAAFVDTWALIAQMRQFFVEGAGREVFGEAQPIAVDLSRRLEAQILEIAQAFVGGKDPAKGRQFVAEWVASHPIEDLLFVRESTMTLTSQWVAAQKTGTFAAIKSMEEQLGELSYRLATMMGYLPRRAGWHAELLLLDATGAKNLHAPLDQIASMEKSMGRLTAEIEGIEATATRVADRQRESLLAEVPKVVDAKLDDLMKRIDDQRLETIGVLREERGIVVAALREEREETVRALQAELKGMLQDIERQRLATLEAITAEREAAMAGADDIAEASLEKLGADLYGAFDRLAWRLAQIAAAAVVAGALGGAVAVRLLRRR